MNVNKNISLNLSDHHELETLRVALHVAREMLDRRLLEGVEVSWLWLPMKVDDTDRVRKAVDGWLKQIE